MRESGYIADLYVTTPTLTTAEVKVSTDGAPQGAKLEVSVLDSAGNTVWTGVPGRVSLPDAQPWNTQHPNLYRCAVRLLGPDGLELAGPTTVTAEGGMCGTYVRTLGRAGAASLTVHTGQTEDVTVNFTIEIEEAEKWT